MRDRPRVETNIAEIRFVVNTHVMMCVLQTFVCDVDMVRGSEQTMRMIKNPINVAFGKAVAQRREELELTQSVLAGLVGMSRASIANIEKGRQNVLLHHLYDLAAALEMSKVGDLLPARPKATLGALQVSVTDGVVSPRDVAQVTDLVASVLATQSAKVRR